MSWRIRTTCLVSGLLGCFPSAAVSEDWPTYGHDNRRSHVSGETLALPLSESWVHRSETPPLTAWTGPARWDAFAGNAGLQSMRNFDPAFFVTAVGDQVFFASSVDNAAHCLDAETGRERWVAFAGSAVRLPPSWHEGRVYFGSDDGITYCLDADTGEEAWRFRPVVDSRMIPSNGKLMSRWPVRTGVMVEEGIAYFGASLFPWESSYLCAVDADSGEKLFVEEQRGITLQGAMLASTARLYAPQGRSLPLVYAKATGSPLGSVAGSGGVYCILTEEEQLIAMPSNQKAKDSVIRVTDPEKRQSVLSISGAERMVAAGKMAFYHRGPELKAIDRLAAIEAQREVSSREAQLKSLQKKKAEGQGQKDPDPGEIGSLEKTINDLKSEVSKWRATRESAETWSVRQPISSALILAGEHLFLGGDDTVTAIFADSGEQAWTAPVEGRVYGLAVANGRLFVSTDRGHIYCFAAR